MLTSLYRVSLSTLLIFILVACSEEAPEQGGAEQMPQMPPPPVVGTYTVTPQTIQESSEYTGRLEAIEYVELRPKVSGYLTEAPMIAGAKVGFDELLFQVDPRPYQAEVNRLQGELESAAAAIELAERDLERAVTLKAKSAISEEQLDNFRTELTQAKALHAAAKGELYGARLSLGASSVRAPIAGTVSRAEVTVGNFVTRGQTLLTRIVSSDQVYAYFEVDEASFIRLKTSDQLNTSVKLGLVNEAGFPHEGRIDFVDNQLDQRSGTIRFRAIFDNSQGRFTPGMFVRVQLPVSEAYEGIAIPETAIGTDLNRKFVYAVDAQNMVGYRPIELGPRMGDLRIVRSGLQAGDRVITSGLQTIFPGMPVTPESSQEPSEVAN